MDADCPSETLVFNRANPVTVSVRRVHARVPGSASVVIKTLSPNGEIVVPHWTAGHEPAHWNLWNRELLAYRCGITDSFASRGLRGPRLLGTAELPDGSVEMRLEDVSGRTGPALEFEDHARINRRLGEAQGRSAAESTGDLQWLSSNWIRQYGTTRLSSAAIYHDVAAWEHPVVVDGFGTARNDLRRRFGELYASAGKWFDLLGSLPQTLCHLDFWPNNVLAAEDGTDVLIDWSFVGRGAIGEDPGNWVLDTFFDHFCEPARFTDLDELVWTAYSKGLVAARWEHSLDLARLGMLASAVKYIWLPGLMVERAGYQGPTGYGSQDGFSIVEVFRRRLVVLEHVLGWIAEAERLSANR